MIYYDIIPRVMRNERAQSLTREHTTIVANGLVADISDIGKQVHFVLGGRDERGFSTPEETRVIRSLENEKDQKILDLLILRKATNTYGVFPIELDSFHGEIIHPFSMTPARIYVPSEYNPLENYFVKFELSDIRRPEKGIKDSLDALKLLGKTEQGESDTKSYLNRTTLELVRIRDMRNGLINLSQIQNTNGFETAIEDLGQLSANLVVQRLFKMDANDEIPQGFKIEFTPNNFRNEVDIEIIKLSTDKQKPDKTYLFSIPSHNIVKALNSESTSKITLNA